MSDPDPTPEEKKTAAETPPSEEKPVENLPIETPTGPVPDSPPVSPAETQESAPIVENAPVEGSVLPAEGEIPAEEKPEFKPEISDELERKIQEEIERKKEVTGEKTVSREEFIEYLKPRRSKVMYLALWQLTFNIEDHQATKQGLYEALKEPTSTSPVEPLPEHKFYFGLKYILKLKLFDQKVCEYVKDKIKLMVNIDNFKEILKEVGEPISTRPKLSDEEKKDIFTNFLKDDFLDL
jgi:hypothetical protein